VDFQFDTKEGEMRTRILVVLLSALFLAVPAVAQEQRGAIEGVVRDSSGGVLPGVTVEARNVALGGTVTVVTDAFGAYRFPALSAGTYDVTAVLQGFNTARVANVEVALGQIKRVEVTLAVAGLAETVQVIAEPPLIDVKQSARSTSLRGDVVERLGAGRDFTSLVTLAPGANNEAKLSGISIDGSSSAENRYIIDGVETTSLIDGTSGKQLISDFIEEVQVKSSGYTAEYGGATGGVINVITKSGTNNLKGTGGFYFASNALDGASRRTLRLSPTDSTKSEYITYKKDDYAYWQPAFSVGGPIAQDRIWFFASYSPDLRSTDRTVTLVENNQQLTKNRKVQDHNLSANVLSQLSDKTRLRFAVNLSPGKADGLLPALDGSNPSTTKFDITDKMPNYSVSGTWDYVASSKLFFSSRLGYYYADHNQTGVHQGPRYWFIVSNIGMAGVPADFQRVTGFSDPPTNWQTDKDEQTRLSWQADTTYFANFGGQHAFKAGLQFDRIGNNVLDGETGNRVRFYWGRTLGGQKGTYGYYALRSNGTTPSRGFITLGDIHSNNVGLFIQDAWTVNNRLTLNLGLRTESERVPSFTDDPEYPDTVIKFGFGQKLAPRAGFAWDLKGDGKWKTYASWGIFYDITKLEMPRGSFGGDRWLEYYYALDTYDFGSVVTGGCPPACSGRLLRGPIDFRHPSFEYLEPDLKPFKLQEAVFGFEHQLSPIVALSARYVHKQVDVAIEDVGALDAQQNEIYTIGNPGFGASAYFFPEGSTTQMVYPKAVRNYDGLELAVNKLMSDNWSARFSYLLSRLYGNYSGLAQSDEDGRVSPNVGRNFDYPLMSFNEKGESVLGRLGTDRPHQVKATFMYSLPMGLSFALHEYVASGIPVTREAAFIYPNNFPVMYLGRVSDGRTPVYSQTDLGVQHDVRLPGNRRLQLSVYMNNLFDQKTATNRFRTRLAPGEGIDIDEVSFYQGVDTEALIAAQGIPTDPRFLMDSWFQNRRSVRFGARFMF
jgi:outer membrane receptor protein involved in Fe transport